MLSSIHPLGERTRQNRWWLTVGAFSLGAVSSGALLGSLLGLTGSVALPFLSEQTALIATALVALAAALLDWAGIAVPGPKRQVNETWIGSFRGWVYGGSFGIELGLGFLTYVVTWGVYAMFVVEVLTLSAPGGALVGAVFGLGRSSTLLLAGFVDRPSRLTAFNRSLARLGPSVRTASPVLLSVLALSSLVVGLT